MTIRRILLAQGVADVVQMTGSGISVLLGISIDEMATDPDAQKMWLITEDAEVAKWIAVEANG
jgi:hypothetical protein